MIVVLILILPQRPGSHPGRLKREREAISPAPRLRSPAAASPALAGPPYLTDDPVPTDTGHWEIYAFAAGEGRGSTIDADAGLDLNYGAVAGRPADCDLPLSFTPRRRAMAGAAAPAMSSSAVKYRFFNDAKHGVSAAVFPRVILPTASHRAGREDAPAAAALAAKGFRRRHQPVRRRRLHNQSRAGNRDFWQAGARAHSRRQQDIVARRRSHPAGRRQRWRHRPDARRRRRDRPAIGPLCAADLGRPDLGRSPDRLSFLCGARPQLLGRDHQHAEAAGNRLRPFLPDAAGASVAEGR